MKDCHLPESSGLSQSHVEGFKEPLKRIGGPLAAWPGRLFTRRKSDQRQYLAENETDPSIRKTVETIELSSSGLKMAFGEAKGKKSEMKASDKVEEVIFSKEKSIPNGAWPYSQLINYEYV
ncbi:unnamed protein product [Protopolystoma xenopodis]|uniref:Uncharacterized protein n=1 Tax=Protopolystoma xenopodis TaxID=117903 RepID=A0A448XB73_9PLAT|nr:unnamed protein product [Protopolystoma xenopodis]